LEETGHRAGRLDFVYTYAPALAYSDELIHIYTARDLVKERDGIDEREIIALERISLYNLESLIRKGLVQDSKTLLALLMMNFFGKGSP